MPVVYQQNINGSTKIGVWHITEPEEFFNVPLQRTITHWHKRLQHLAGRTLLKTLHPEFPLEQIMISDTKKPFLENESCHFSISHSGDYAAAIVSTEYRVGVDVEWFNPKLGEIAGKFMKDNEWRELTLTSPQYDVGSSLEWQTLCWCVKETIYKWWGEAGVDFKKDIHILSVYGLEEGTVNVLFRGEIELVVHFIKVKENYLAWVLSKE